MNAKIQKTNVARLLDKAKIPYELVPYEVDENNLAATHVAEQLHEDISQVFKTLILRGDRNGLFVCIVPGDAEVDLKKAAKASGNKSAEMILMKELLPFDIFGRPFLNESFSIFLQISLYSHNLKIKISCFQKRFKLKEERL